MTAGPGDDASSVVNVSDLLDAAADAHPDRPALISAAGQYRWGQLRAAVDAGAEQLHELGLSRGDRVIVALGNSAEIVAVLFAIARAGLIAVPLTPSRLGPTEKPAADVAPALVIGDVAGLAGVPRLGAADLAAWWTTDAPRRTPAAGGEELAMLVRASTSEHPVMISHRAIRAAVTALTAAPRLALRPDDRAVQVLPLSHLAGWVTGFLPLATVGAAAVLPELPDTSGGWIDAVLATIRVQRVTIVPAAPSLYRRLRTASGVERALATVRLMTSGASPLDAEDFAGVRSHTGQPVWEGYGIAEAASAVASSLMTPVARPGSVGLPFPGTEIRITEDGEPRTVVDVPPPDETVEVAEEPVVVTGDGEIVADLVGEGGVGHIGIRGAVLFSGYWPDGRGGPDEDGWFTCDDVGYFDDQGELHLVDRAGESLRIAGFTVYPREIEDILGSHPYVRDAAVVGVPGRGGERMIAVLVAQRGTRPTPDDLDEFVAARLPVFKRPARFRLVERLPRNEVGRVDRAAVRREYLLDPDPDPTPPVRLASSRVDESGPDATARSAGGGRRVPAALVDRISRLAQRPKATSGTTITPAATGSITVEDELF